METLKNFWTELKDRLNNPFIGSYLIAWLIINYPIPITLIFYKKADLRPEYTSYLDVINKNIDGLNMVYIPLVIAFGYTFVFPYFKNYVSIFLAKRSLEADQKISENAKGTRIPIERYVKVQTEYAQQKIELAKIIDDEDNSRKEILRLEAQIITINSDHQLSIDKLNEAHSKAMEEQHNKSAELVRLKQKEHESALEYSKTIYESEYNRVRTKLDETQQQAIQLSDSHTKEVGDLMKRLSTLESRLNEESQKRRELEQELEIAQDPDIIVNRFLNEHQQLLDNWWDLGKVKLLVPKDYKLLFDLEKRGIPKGSSVFNRILGHGTVTLNNGASSFRLQFSDANIMAKYDEIELFVPKTMNDIL